MSDQIDRQAAIDAIGKASDELYENIKKGATFPQRQWFDGMAHAQSILENLPSAQPEQRWIPVSERLPEKNGDYLVTGRKGAVSKRKYDNGRWYGGWYVLAWQTLPEPYREE